MKSQLPPPPYSHKGFSCFVWKKNLAFTLAEVLITLTIIGVVAALTVPTLMKNYQKKVVETKVLKFYSTMQNAIRMSINENGPFETWIEEGVNNLDYEKNKAHLEKYILPYLKYEEVFEGDMRGRPIVKLSDGSYFRFNAKSAAQLGWNTNLVIFVFFTDLKDTINCTPRNCFVFDTDKTLYIKPYDREWSNDRNKLMNDATWGCKKGFYNGSQNGFYCAKLLQLNGWKFPDDYPW